MLFRRLACVLAVALLGAGPLACAPDDGNDVGADAALPPQPDEDGDGISDADEGRAAATDSDGDGTPDYLDADADEDGIPDEREAGDADTNTAPPDTDGDGTPDFRDTDSDANGRADAVDGTGDVDGDGKQDFADLDDDGDLMNDPLELGADPATPVDTDGDGAPDFRDPDSDADTIRDADELMADPDMDQVPAFRDDDADGDCRKDASEAADADPLTPPPDGDGDGFGDFLDLDSDNDGLRDQQEDPNCNGAQDAGESSATDEDSDNDGVTDLVEVAAGTNATDPASNPAANGDFFFVEPYQLPQSPEQDKLEFATAFRNVDIMFNIDISGSMATEISSLKTSITTVVNTLVCDPGEDPVVTGCIPDLQTGVTTFGEKANPSVVSFKRIDANNLGGAGTTQNALPSSAPGYGDEQALRSIGVDENGTANDGFLRNGCAGDATRFGKACYRGNSLRLVVEATDETLNEDDAFAAGTHQGIVDFAMQNNVQLIGVWSESGNRGNLISEWAGLASGGVPFVPVLQSTNVGTPACNALGAGAFSTIGGLARAIVQGDGNQSANAITCAIQAVVKFVKQAVEATAKNDPANVDAMGTPVDAPAAFIDHVEVFMDNTAQCPTYPTVQDGNGDGFPDVIVGLLPGKNVCWKIFTKMNTTVMGAPDPQLFRATIEVTGQGGALLDAREVFFLVPPVIVNPPIN